VTLNRPACSRALRFGELGIEVTDVVEELDVRAGVGARRAADGRLIDDDQLVELIDAFDAIVFARLTFAAHERREEGLGDDVVNEASFARAGDSGDTDERAEGDFDIDVFEVVVASADNAYRGGRSEERGIDPTFFRDFYLAFAGEECAGNAAFFVGDFVGSSTPTTSPPRTPGRGRSRSGGSAARMVSSSCSTTTTVLPRSRSWASVARS